MTAPVGTFATALRTGRLDPEPLGRFPEQPAEDRRVGDTVLAGLDAFLRERIDPDRVDLTGELPTAFVDELRRSAYLKLRLSRRIGGLDLSPYNAFRAIEQAATWSTPAGQMLAIQAGVGAPALLPGIPPGPLLDHVNTRLSAGAYSGFGLTGPDGQNNTWPAMTATPTPDGRSYVLHGAKIFTGHGPVADLLPVAATEASPDGCRLCIAFVDTRAAGFSVRSRIEFTGSRGLPNGALDFDHVSVPTEHVVRGEPEDPRFPEAMRIAVQDGQLYFTAAPALAIAKLCERWSGEFVERRAVDGRNLADYAAVQRIVATTLADVYAMESTVRWSLLGAGPGERLFERLVSKNVCVRGAWRVVDRTISLYGAEGVETVPSKRRRGVPAVPLERRFRDARALRIAGNVDFRLDSQAALMLLAGPSQGADTPTADAPSRLDLTDANQVHLADVARQTREFHDACRALVRRFPDRVELLERQQSLIVLGRIAGELFAAYAVLARAAGPDRYSTSAQELADVYCVEAGHRLADQWRRIDAPSEPDYAKISRRWLSERKQDPPTHETGCEQ